MLVVFEAMSRRRGAVVDDDVLFRFRLRLFSLAAELGNVREACRIFGVIGKVGADRVYLEVDNAVDAFGETAQGREVSRPCH